MLPTRHLRPAINQVFERAVDVAGRCDTEQKLLRRLLEVWVRFAHQHHDGRRVAVDQDDLVTLFAQGLAGLGAGIVELTGLADDDRAGADDEDGL